MGEMIERLADIEHERWSHWMKYLFSKSIKNENGPEQNHPVDLEVFILK